MNPILPLHYAAPDGEPHVWKNDPDTLYLYATNELVGCPGDRPVQHVWSTKNLTDWEEHVPGFDAGQAVDFEDVAALRLHREGRQILLLFHGGGKAVRGFL